MSLEMQTFVPMVDDALIPDWIARLNGLGMHCEIFPGFSFKNCGGFLPFRVVLNNGFHNTLTGVDLLTGFELYLNEFSLEHELDLLKPIPTLIDKLTRKKPQPVYFAMPEIDQRLAACTKVLCFVWGTGDTFELRMAKLSALVLADITNGVSLYPADGIWYTSKDAIENALKEIEEYEASLNPDQLIIHKFQKWL